MVQPNNMFVFECFNRGNHRCFHLFSCFTALFW